MKFTKLAIYLLAFLITGFCFAHSAFAANVYYSVGQDTTTDRKVASNITISSGVGTFTAAQTGNIGVGDRVTYQTGVNHICYISAKQSTTVWNLVTATGAACPDHASIDVVSIKREYASLSAAEAGALDANHINSATGDLVTQTTILNLPCYYDTGADTTAVTIDGWITSASYYIKIYTPNNTSTEANTSQRHSGVWNTGKYRMAFTATLDGFKGIEITGEYVKIEGLQFSIDANTHNNVVIIKPISYVGETPIEISHSIFKKTDAGTTAVIGINKDLGDGVLKVWNCVAYNFGAGTWARAFNVEVGTAYFYNNTVHNCTTGFMQGGGTVIAKNNISYNNTVDYSGTFNSSSTYNLSKDATAPGVATCPTTPTNCYYRSITDLAFVNAGTDFHLASSDIRAKNLGVDLNPDDYLTITNDIDNETRPDGANTWDIGADETYGPYNVYYSVGQDGTTDRKTGSPTITISSGVATFSAAQTGNIGVGDRVTYDNTNIAYISGKVSATQWNVVTAKGKTPSDVTTGLAVNSILREYTSLSSAIAGAVDSSHLNTTDLVAGGDFILNLPCYYDTGADTTAVTVTGYTTGANNYIKIYTPNNTSTEANQSQRHDGKWNTGKYRLEVNANQAFLNYENYTHLEGLQIYNTKTAIGSASGITSDGGYFYISYCIVKGQAADSGANATYGIFYNQSGNAYIWNNIIYDINKNSGAYNYGVGIFTWLGTHYVYNNTVYNCNTGYYSPGAVFAKNNLSYNNTDNYNGTFNAASTNNLSGPSSDAQCPATNAKNGFSVNFVSTTSGSEDFHLASSDLGARDSGTDLNPDTYLTITNDIDGQTRPDGANTWDIGADEYKSLVNVYYSVGQDGVTDRKTGSPTITISNGLATFSAAQTGNIGVGDVIDYDTDNKKCYISGKTSQTVWSVVTATGETPANVSGLTVNSIKRVWTSLTSALAGAGNSSHLTTFDLTVAKVILNLPCYYDTGADTTAVVVDGYTTGADNYIKIYTPNNTATECNQSQRHSGKWSAAKYNLSPATGIPFTLSDENVRLEGMQLASVDDHGLYLNGATSSSNIYLSQNIIKGNSTASKYGLYLASTSSTSQAYIWNNLVYDYTGSSAIGFYQDDADWTTYLYNNTFSGNSGGLNTNAGGTVAINNLVSGSGNTNSYIGTFASGTDYNSTDSTDVIGQGTRNKISQTFTFIDQVNKDFHLASSDLGARDSGTDLSGDPSLPFSTDIDNHNRLVSGSGWDIGADETVGGARIISRTDSAQTDFGSATPIYRSVGPSNTSALASGASNSLTISGSAAAFSSPLADRIGVGDALQYDDDSDGDIDANDSLVFIHGRTSNRSYTVKTASGGVPTAVSGDNDWSIFRAYTSLSLAEAGTENTGIDSDLRNFDTWSLGKDITSSNEVWNIACYGDAADTTAVTIDGWTTDATRYIRVYTPTAKTEVGVSQRHQGKWNTGRYRLQSSSGWRSGVITIKEENVRLEGLQINNTGASDNTSGGIVVGSTAGQLDIRISNNIIFGLVTGVSVNYYSGIVIADNLGSGDIKIWNNIIYNFKTTSSAKGGGVFDYNDGYGGSGNLIIYAYNNTAVNTNYGYGRLYETFIAKNNISYNNTDNYNGTFTSSDYNLSGPTQTDAPGANSQQEKSLTFINTTAGSEDFHLISTDTNATGKGIDLNPDPSGYLTVTDDIDGQIRPDGANTWDIGADEKPSVVRIKGGVRIKR